VHPDVDVDHKPLSRMVSPAITTGKKGSWNATGAWLGAALTFLVIEVGGLYLFFARALFVGSNAVWF
jgi:hypothetical protein